MTMLALTDLHVLANEDEPRVRDIRLAEVLEFSRSNDIRKLIDRYKDELERYGSLRHRGAMIEIGKGAKREVSEYWLNEGQALFICAKSDAPRANDVLHQVITVYIAWRRGRMPAESIVTMPALDNLFDRKLQPVHQELGSLNVRVTSIEGNVVRLGNRIDDIVPARQFSEKTRVVWQRALQERFQGDCPCCRAVKIIYEGKRVTKEIAPAVGARYAVWNDDHFSGRELNRTEDGWPVCARCNQKLKDLEFKSAKRKRFEVFHEDLRLFTRLVASSPKRRSPNPSEDQGNLF